MLRLKIDNELVDSLNEGLRAFGESTKLNETISAASVYQNIINPGGVKNMNVKFTVRTTVTI